MSAVITPSSLAELAAAVRAHPRVLAVGAGTKPRLSSVGDDVVRLSTAKLSGITEYEPDEYTFTALAGTPLRDLHTALAAQGQCLPFDPLFVDAGATLGGTVAAGISGPGRFRYGGLRDFILGVRFIDGTGRELRLGGKVVKNAAGFDVPKFFVGSLGRFGVMAEFTFKVFPRPRSLLTLRLPVATPAAALDLFTAIGLSRWEADAVDLLPDEEAVALRLAGPAEAITTLAQEILARFPGEILTAAVADSLWTDLREVRWAPPDETLLKIPLTPAQVPALCSRVHSLGGRVHVSAGGNVAWVALPPGTDATPLGLPALTLRGPGPLWTLPPPVTAISQAVKQAFDPDHRFPSLA